MKRQRLWVVRRWNGGQLEEGFSSTRHTCDMSRSHELRQLAGRGHKRCISSSLEVGALTGDRAYV